MGGTCPDSVKCWRRRVTNSLLDPPCRGEEERGRANEPGTYSLVRRLVCAPLYSSFSFLVLANLTYFSIGSIDLDTASLGRP